MEENGSLPPLADLTVSQVIRDELNLSDSDSDSDSTSNMSLCLHNGKHSAKDRFKAWTNEKHNRYLDHLESSFVKQLHQSIGALAWCSEHDSKGPYLSENLHVKTQKTSQKLKIIQDDCMEKVDLKRSRHVLNRAAESLESRSWCAGKECFVKEPKLQESGISRNLCTKDKNIFFNEAGICSKKTVARHGSWIDCIAEFSDQNFVDEASEQMHALTKSKRSKTII